MTTKKAIVSAVADKLDLTHLETKEIVQSVIDCIAEALVEERRIELRNFGVFEVKKRATRNARNPKTGDKVKVKEKHIATFKAGKVLEKAIQVAKRTKGKSKP